MSRFNSWLNELQPDMFVELSPELAAERGIVHGGWATVRTPRGAIEVRALVTRRLQPLRIDGRTVHQVGLPIHWGFAGESVEVDAIPPATLREMAERCITEYVDRRALDVLRVAERCERAILYQLCSSGGANKPRPADHEEGGDV